jgi:hypothetical protein
VSAHSASHRRSWLSALVAQVSDYVFEEIEETVEPQLKQLEPHPVVAAVAAAARSGATTVARMLAAELATRADGAAVVVAAGSRRRAAPPSRAAVRLATALVDVVDAQPVGRLCVAAPAAIADPDADSAGGHPGGDSAGGHPSERIVNAARYLAPVVLDLPADGSAAGVRSIADRVVVVSAASGEPALLDAVAAVIGGSPLKVANRVTDPGRWAERADILLPDSRLGIRAAALGTRALGSLGSAIGTLADSLETPR